MQTTTRNVTDNIILLTKFCLFTVFCNLYMRKFWWGVVWMEHFAQNWMVTNRIYRTILIRNFSVQKFIDTILPLFSIGIPILSLKIPNATIERDFSIVIIQRDKLWNKISIRYCWYYFMLRFIVCSNCHNFVPSQNMLMKFNSAAVYATHLSSDDEKTLDAISESTAE